jgi:hypothetical protein
MTALGASLCQATVLFPRVSLACVIEPKELVTVLRLRKERSRMAGMAKARASFDMYMSLAEYFH